MKSGPTLKGCTEYPCFFIPCIIAAVIDVLPTLLVVPAITILGISNSHQYYRILFKWMFGSILYRLILNYEPAVGVFFSKSKSCRTASLGWWLARRSPAP